MPDLYESSFLFTHGPQLTHILLQYLNNSLYLPYRQRFFQWNPTYINITICFTLRQNIYYIESINRLTNKTTDDKYIR